MLARLRKYANWSKSLNAAKGTALKATAKGTMAAGLGYVALTNAAGAKGQYQQNAAGFRPEVHSRLLGNPPTPPGT